MAGFGDSNNSDDLRTISFELGGSHALQLWIGVEDGRLVGQVASRYCCSHYAPIDVTGDGLAHVLWLLAEGLRERKALNTALGASDG